MNNAVSLQNQIVYGREMALPKFGAGLCCASQKAVSTCAFSLKKKKEIKESQNLPARLAIINPS
jgi:hypothetical protein